VLRLGYTGRTFGDKCSLHEGVIEKRHARSISDVILVATSASMSYRVSTRMACCPCIAPGTNFINSMRHRMPEKLVTANVGSRFTFGA
jgi:hypothetical protein